MERKNTRRIIAVIALVFMVIFTVTLIITFVDNTLWNGTFGYMALVSGMIGIGLFLVVKFVFKDESAQSDGSGGDADKPQDEPDTRGETQSGEDAED